MVFATIKAYSLEAVTALLCLAVLYSAARYEVMDVLSSSSGNDVVAAPLAR